MDDQDNQPESVCSSQPAASSEHVRIRSLLSWLWRRLTIYDPRIDNSYSSFYSLRSVAQDFYEHPLLGILTLFGTFISLYVLMHLRTLIGL